MKKSIIITVALLFIYCAAFSQVYSAPPPPPPSSAYANGADKNFHFGISVVPNLAWLTPGNTNNVGNGLSLGFGFGVNLEFYFTQNYGFVTGVSVANIPGKYTNTSPYTIAGKAYDSSTAYTYHMQYLEIPLLFKFRTLPINLMRYFAMVGFNPGVRLKSSGDQVVTGGIANATESGVDINSSTSFIRLAYVFGAGVEYNIAGTTSLQGFVSYDAGFLNINTSSSSNVTSKSITLTLGVLF